MKIKIYACPFKAPAMMAIEGEWPRGAEVLYLPEVLGPYGCIEAFVGRLKTNPENIVIVTQYPHLLNAVGQMISENLISHTDASVVLILEDGARQDAEFDDEGFLANGWVFGIMDGHADIMDLRRSASWAS